MVASDRGWWGGVDSLAAKFFRDFYKLEIVFELLDMDGVKEINCFYKSLRVS